MKRRKEERKKEKKERKKERRRKEQYRTDRKGPEVGGNRMEWDIMGPGSGPGSGSKILSLKKSPQIWQMP